MDRNKTSPDSLECSEVLLRGVTLGNAKRTWDNEHHRPKVGWQAFALRRKEQYLSVDRQALSSPGQSFTRWNCDEECAVLALSLHTGRVCDLDSGLDVVAEPEAENQAHAGIRGLPNRFSGDADDKERACELGWALLEMARLAGYSGPEVQGEWERRRQEAEGRDA